MTNMLLDEPIERVEQDALGRADFAQSVADLILTAPQGSSSQVIGLYGKWGEGKTSLKNMVAECLIDLDGAALARNAIAAVGARLACKFTAVDLEPLPSGTVRWVNRTQFARQRLKEYGLIRKNSRYGLWELTEAGNRWATDPSKPPFPSTPIPEENPAQPEFPF